MINIPNRIESLLRADASIHSFVLNVINAIVPWVRDNKAVFFPEYTDHSDTHLEEVLATADSLISDISWAHLTPHDAAILVVSVLLHDCALHLSEDGFLLLVKKNENPIVSKYLDVEPSWSLLWSDFLAEAKRFDHKKLKELFGSIEPVGNIPKNKIDFTLKHRLLIGDFLRRHHARLAHEIAINGIPGVEDLIKISSGNSSDLLDLAGYVARSHNMTIRNAVDALEQQKKRIHMNCHVPFLMVVLRISDYIQIQSSRAPGQLLLLKSLVSPISRREWKKHSAIKEINQAHDDPESIYVECEPETSVIFSELQRLMCGIQSELDQCWSVMGEVYGRFKPLDELGINIRRIRSNLDNSDLFFKSYKPNYIPGQFKFRTANAELIDLLIGPLYGEKPEIGIREMVQNAIDACLERDSYYERENNRSIERPNNDVVVTLQIPIEGSPSLIIEDYGIGMSLSVVENYFLNVGASFRHSDAWRKLHEVNGRSKIHRSGRFGVGVLAAFLLGKEVKVTTRHISLADNCGLMFNCTQGDHEIEIQPCTFRHGTKIEIKITQQIAEHLAKEKDHWDWYCLSYPKLNRIIVRSNQEVLDQRIEVPSCNDNIDAITWRRIEVDLYDDVLWTYSHVRKVESDYYDPTMLICNGIFVSNNLNAFKFEISPGFNIITANFPALVVYDPDGKFPINLQRNALAAMDVGFNYELMFDVSMFFVDKLLPELMKVTHGISAENIEKLLEHNSIGYENWFRTGSYVNHTCPYIFNKKGITPVDFELLSRLKISSIVLDAIDVNNCCGAYESSIFSDWVEFYLPIKGASNSRTSKVEFIKKAIGGIGYDNKPYGLLHLLPICGRRIFIREADVENLVGSGRVPKWQFNQFELEIDLGEWLVLKMGNVPDLDFELDLESMVAELEAAKAFCFFVLYMDWDSNTIDIKTPFADAWIKYVPSIVFHTK